MSIAIKMGGTPESILTVQLDVKNGDNAPNKVLMTSLREPMTGLLSDVHQRTAIFGPLNFEQCPRVQDVVEA